MLLLLSILKSVVMFERLGEIVASGERFLSEAEEPPIFLWFPMKSKFEYIPPNLINEGLDFKIERVVKLAKSARSDLSQLNGVELGIEEQIIRFFELKDEVEEYQGMLRDCEEDPAAREDPAKEKVGKARHILDEIETAIKQTGTESFAVKLKTENEFNVGIQRNLIPWIDELERTSLKQLAKPDNFEHARDIERESVLFAKDVRKANKLLQQLEGNIDNLPDRKMFANQQIQEQKVRFKNIATIAATRVETMRDLLVNWNFFIETKAEGDRLTETTQKMFSLSPLPEDFNIDENDFVHGLPKIMLGWLHLSESVLKDPPKPTNLEHSVELQDLIKKFVAVAELASKLLEKIEECTEKTPSHGEVWEQRGRMKKVLERSKDLRSKLETLTGRWRAMEVSEGSDNLDFQPLMQFLQFYTSCYV